MGDISTHSQWSGVHNCYRSHIKSHIVCYGQLSFSLDITTHGLCFDVKTDQFWALKPRSDHSCSSHYQKPSYNLMMCRPKQTIVSVLCVLNEACVVYMIYLPQCSCNQSCCYCAAAWQIWWNVYLGMVSCVGGIRQWVLYIFENYKNMQVSTHARTQTHTHTNTTQLTYKYTQTEAHTTHPTITTRTHTHTHTTLLHTLATPPPFTHTVV